MGVVTRGYLTLGVWLILKWSWVVVSWTKVGGLLIRSSIVFWPLELNFKSLHSNLETVHGCNGGLRTSRIIKTDKSKALALVGCSVNEDFGADNVPEGKKHLHELGVAKLLGKMVDEEIASLWSTDGTTYKG